MEKAKNLELREIARLQRSHGSHRFRVGFTKKETEFLDGFKILKSFSRESCEFPQLLSLDVGLNETPLTFLQTFSQEEKGPSTVISKTEVQPVVIPIIKL